MIDASLYYSTELYHHGVKGQKWGVRRTQQQLGHNTSSVKSKLASAGNTVKTYGAKAGAVATKATKAGIRELKKARAARVERENKKISGKRSYHTLSDQDLRNRIARMQLEEQYESHLRQTGRIKDSMFTKTKNILGNAGKQIATDLVTKTGKALAANLINSLAGEEIMKMDLTYKSKKELKDEREKAAKKAAKEKEEAEKEAKNNKEQHFKSEDSLDSLTPEQKANREKAKEKVKDTADKVKSKVSETVNKHRNEDLYRMNAIYSNPRLLQQYLEQQGRFL